MVIIGVDAHKRVQVAVVVDEAGRILSAWRGANTPAQWAALGAWAQGQGEERRWGIEGSGGYGRGLAQALVEAGETVYEVNPRLTAALRQRARRRDKSDRLDAQAVAQAVLREGDALPRVQGEDETTVAGLLTRERETVVAEATRLRNQLHALLLQVDPGYRDAYPDLRKEAVVARLTELAVEEGHPARQARVATVRRLAARLLLVLQQLREVTEEIRAFAAEHAGALTQMAGVQAVNATALVGLLGPPGRFRSEACLAAYGGVAPLEASSAGKVRHRLNRGGNRRLNCVLYRIALSQVRHREEARRYVQRRMAEGKTWREAIRALKRFIARRVFRLWQSQCSLSPPPAPLPT